jgi:hypothetical protein
MQNESAESADIWRAAQHRRTEDLGEWLGHFLIRSDKLPGQPILKPRLALARAIAIAVITFGSVISVSAVVEAKRSPHVVLRPTSPMPAVNVP